MQPRYSSPFTVSQWIRDSSGNNGSVQVLAQNERRASLTIENMSLTATLYFCFSGDANANAGLALGPGKGIILDVVCPQAALFLFMDSVTNQQCGVMEISYLCES